MKKLLALLLTVLLIAAVVMMFSVPALADDGGESEPFFTWVTLATYAGALAATIAITQMLKGVGFIAKVPTRLFSWFIALVILLAANYFTNTLTAETASMCILNAVVVSLAANGGYDAVTGVLMKKT